jgi:hypothetical protein
MWHPWFVIAPLAIAGLAGPVIAADLKIPPRPTPQNISIQQGPANCSRWTDECVNCARGAGSEPAVCSNIGFACQPKAIRCLEPAAKN